MALPAGEERECFIPIDSSSIIWSRGLSQMDHLSGSFRKALSEQSAFTVKIVGMF
jgi:hypothetical protein